MAGFHSLTWNVSIYRSRIVQSQETVQHPRLVVLCSWMGAARKHVLKYTAGYQELFPSADILLVQSELPDFIWRTHAQQDRRLQPAVDVIQRALVESDWHEGKGAAPPVLFCAMSDGGLNSATHLARIIMESYPYKALPAGALVLDSCPNIPQFRRGWKAFSMSLPKNLISRIFGKIAICVFLLYWWLLKQTGDRSPIQVNRRQLIGGQLFSKSTPRLYMVSKGDQLTDWDVVLRHADEAEAAGHPIKRVLFNVGAHCALITEDSVKYWAAVREIWQQR